MNPQFEFLFERVPLHHFENGFCIVMGIFE
jgi:hypothetical protein